LSQNYAEAENSPAISTIFDLMTFLSLKKSNKTGKRCGLY